jgi:hypothetical protein
MLLRKSVRKSKIQAGDTEMWIKDIQYQNGVQWFDNNDAEVVDITFETPNGETFTQRETFSYHKSSNFGKLVRVVLGKSEYDPIDEIDTDDLYNKAIIGEVFQWSNANGDTYDKARNFRPVDFSVYEGAIR